MIDRAKRKRFYLLCKDYAGSPSFIWWRFKIVSNTYGVENPLPSYSGDKGARVAWREHVRDLIGHYAEKNKMPCGHYSRHEVCYKCKQIAYEAAVKDFEELKARRAV